MRKNCAIVSICYKIISLSMRKSIHFSIWTCSKFIVNKHCSISKIRLTYKMKLHNTSLQITPYQNWSWITVELWVNIMKINNLTSFTFCYDCFSFANRFLPGQVIDQARFHSHVQSHTILVHAGTKNRFWTTFRPMFQLFQGSER